MGRSRFIPLTITTREPGVMSTPGEWKIGVMGQPTEANIAKYVEVYIRSQYEGGCNDHLPRTFGRILVPSYAEIKRHRKNQAPVVIATWKAPMFMALPS